MSNVEVLPGGLEIVTERRSNKRDVMPPRDRLNLKLSVIATRAALLEIARLWQADRFWKQWSQRQMAALK